jgi:predicted nucleotidyltransferase
MALEDLLKAKREEILRVCAKYGAHNVRVFGSVARGEADELSDIDFLVELEPGRSLFDLGGLQYDLEQLWGAGWMWSQNVVSSLVSESVCFERHCHYERPQGTAAGHPGSDRRH